MKTESINDYNINKTSIPNFKGKVAPEFVQYVNELRNDCLEINPNCNTAINNICDSIIDRASTVMEKCFHPLSILSIDKTDRPECDVITIPNEIITKYAIGRMSKNAGFIGKKGKERPIMRLRHLRNCINGDSKHYSCFLEAYLVSTKNLQDIIGILDQYANNNCDKKLLLKNLFHLLSLTGQSNIDIPLIEILKGGGNYQGALNEILSLLEFGQNHIDIVATDYYDHKNWSNFYKQIISGLNQNVEKLINIQEH